MAKLFTSLRSRLILLVILTSIPGILVMVRSALDQRQQAIQSARQEIVYLEHMTSNMQTLLVDNVRSFLLVISHLPADIINDSSACSEILAHVVSEHFDYYSAFYIADLNGNIVCRPSEGHVPPDFNNCEHYQELKKAQDFIVSGYHICKETGKSVISIGYPVQRVGEEVSLVANVSLDVRWFSDFISNAGLPEGAEFLMLDENGTILTHYPEHDLWQGETIPEWSILPKLFTLKNGELIGTGLTKEETLYVISELEDTTGRVYVVLGIPTRVVFAEANQTLKENLYLFLIVEIIAIGLMWLLGDAIIVKQARTLVGVTRKLGEGDLNVRTGINYNSGELGELAQSFDAMASDLAAREEERARNEFALKEYAAYLEQSNRELRDFTSIASHDMQEPLRKIQTFGELLQERSAASLDAQGVDYVNRMQNAAKRMSNLIHELLVYSRVTTKATQFDQVDLGQAARQALIDLEVQIEAAGAEVIVGDLPVIEANPVQMNQLMQNLISNAIKFHRHDQKPLVRVYSPQSPEDEANGMVEIRVQDNGIGIDEAFLERIFQPFQRLNVQTGTDGVGMGLTICRKIVEHHKGSIRAESSPDGGTTFIVRLPRNYHERLVTE